MFAATKTFASIVNRRETSLSSSPPAQPPTATLLDRLGNGGALDASEQAAGGRVLHGTLSLTELREGFFLHRTDVTYLRGMTSCFPLSGSGVRIVLKLQGGGRLCIGERALPLVAGTQGAVIALREPALYEHRCRAASRERMLFVTLLPPWLEQAGLGDLNARPHLSMTAWAPSARAVCIAEQLLSASGAQGGPLQGLQQERLALELVIEALAQLAPAQAPQGSTAIAETASLRPGEYQRACRLRDWLEHGPLPRRRSARACRLRDWLDSGAADALTLGAIAQHMGCNASTLQSQFRQAFGKAIFDHLRESRLRRAANAITAQGITMAQAAELAGYRSPANFSTAFRRLYGFAPKNLLGRKGV